MSFHTLLFALLILCAHVRMEAQGLSQTIRGTVLDQESDFPLAGATVSVVTEGEQVLGDITDERGRFRIKQVPVGRVTVKAAFPDYQTAILSNIQVNSAKEVILEIKLKPWAVKVDAVEIVANEERGIGNEMATVSARRFSVEESGLYAGSRAEPARMASNYAGVQGADDSRNDIVIRGNSPQGVLWRLEGINIPNPNHFAIPGTGGGPVTILNNKFLSNSDFYTGAFPAQFGNTTAGVFDLNMREGNNEQHEFSGQFGFLGTELMAEGPMSRDSSASYLATYRYSTLGLFSFLGINVGTDAIPKYQDGAFRIHLPLKNKATLAIWGMGGLSDIDIVLSEQEEPDDSELYARADRDQYFNSKTGVTAISYTQAPNSKTLIKASLGISHQGVDANDDYIFRRIVQGKYIVDSLPPMLDYSFRDSKVHAVASLKKRFGTRHVLQAGFNLDWHHMLYIDSARVPQVDSLGEVTHLGPWHVRWDARDGAALFQPYVQYKLNLDDRFTLVAGLTSLYWSLNRNSFSPLEPRIGMSYDLGKKKSLNFGAGLHSQVQSPYLYQYGFETVGRDPQEHNMDLGLTKSFHAVLGYDCLLGQHMRLRLESYYQYLYDIPVTVRPSSFSLVNSGTGFDRFFPDTLINAGTGRNFGLELTVERSFANGYYFLLTGSVFDSKYRGSDGILRNTSFNGRLAANAVFAKEFPILKDNILQLSGKATYGGGRWYGPVDHLASTQLLQVIFTDATVNTLQFRPYFRLDLKALFRWNRTKVSYEFGLDLVNVLGIQNILKLTYAPNDSTDNDIREEYQLGFLPIFYYRIDF